MESTPISGKLIAQSWEQWILSEEGKKCLRPDDILKDKKYKKLLYNRLWYAFMAGQRSMESNNQ